MSRPRWSRLAEFDLLVRAARSPLQRELDGALTSFEVMWEEYYRLTTTPAGAERAALAPRGPRLCAGRSAGQPHRYSWTTSASSKPLTRQPKRG
jgi:hypothetical protein